MKKRFILVSAIILLIVLIVSVSSASAVEYNFTINDVTQIQKVIVNQDESTSEYITKYDLNNNGRIDIMDATIVQKILVNDYTRPTDTEPTTEIVTEPITKPVPTTAPTPISTQPTTLVPSYINLNYSNLELGKGESGLLVATTDLPNSEITFLSENPSVVTVDEKGNFNAVSIGSATITASCNGISTECNVTVGKMASSISLCKTSIKLGVGEEYNLYSTIPDGTFASFRSYKTDNKNIANINQSGLLSANGVGTTTVYCTLQNGVQAKCTVEILPLATSLTLNATNITLGIGEKFDFNSSIPSGTAAFFRNYYISNSDVASITIGGGIVTAKSVGTATVSCVLTNGVTANCTLTVKPAPKTLSLSSSALTLKVGQNSTILEYTNSGSYANSTNLVWTSSNPKVATITKGSANKAEIKPMMQGTTKITVTTYNGLSASCNLTVSGSAVKCIDVSTWQGSIDFNKVKSAGYNYVIIRVGFGDSSKNIDNRFIENYDKAKKAGLKVGAYWFSYAMSLNDTLKEANACIKCLNGRQLDMPVYYDLEYTPAITGLSKATYTSMAIQFCNKIKGAGYKPGVYSSASVFDGYPLDYKQLVDNKISIWNAEWNDIGSSHKCDIWQHADDGKVSGISTYVDLNYIYNLNILN